MTNSAEGFPSRSVLVTGGSRGIGAAIVRSLSNRGLTVGCGYRSGLAEAKALAAALPAPVIPVPYSLGDNTSAVEAVEHLVEHAGGLDSLILNAGIWAGGKLAKMEPCAWQEIAHAAVDGAAQLSRAALPHLAKSGQGSIVLVSSVVGLIGHPGDTAYASSKAALIGFGRSLAKETARAGIRVNILAPGFVATDMTAGVSDAARAEIERATTLGRLGTPEEIAAAAVFLSEDATFCTGTVLTVDGGWSI